MPIEAGGIHRSPRVRSRERCPSSGMDTASERVPPLRPVPGTSFLILPPISLSRSRSPGTSTPTFRPRLEVEAFDYDSRAFAAGIGVAPVRSGWFAFLRASARCSCRCKERAGCDRRSFHVPLSPAPSAPAAADCSASVMSTHRLPCARPGRGFELDLWQIAERAEVAVFEPSPIEIFGNRLRATPEVQADENAPGSSRTTDTRSGWALVTLSSGLSVVAVFCHCTDPSRFTISTCAVSPVTLPAL